MRRAQTDGGSQPVHNYCSQPRSDGNSGSTIVRRNLYPSPRGTASAGFGGYGAQTTAVNVAITGHPEGFTTAIRVTQTGSNPGILLQDVAEISTDYVMSAWVYHEATTVNATQGFAQQSVTSQPGADNPIVAGVWQKISWMRYSGASTNPLGFRIAGTTTGSTFLITGIVLEKGEVVLPFFDGDTASGGDFTYDWSGTAGNSQSRQLAPTPSFMNTTGGAVRSLYQSNDRPHGPDKFARLLCLSAGSPAIGINPTDTTIKSGVARTDLVWIRTSRAMNMKFRYRTVSGAGLVDWGRFSTPANEWVLVRAFGSPAVGNNAAFGIITDTTTGVQAGDTIDVGRHMSVEGTYLGDYLDGESPFSRWDGTVKSSTSVGYPPQLYDIAGKPLVDVSNPGSYALDDSFGIAEPRTLYSVVSVLSTAVPSSPVVTYGVTGLADTVSFQTMMLRLQQHPTTGLLGALNRRTSGAGPVSYTLPQPATSVVCWGMADDGTQFVRNNGGVVVTSGQVMAVPHQQIDVFAATAFHKHVRTIIYRGNHDAATRLAVSRYLGNKYGASVA